MGITENLNVFVIIDIGQMNIQIFLSILPDHGWKSEYICLGKEQRIFRQMDIFV